MGQGPGDEIILNKFCNSQEQLKQWISLQSGDLESTDYKIFSVQCLGVCWKPLEWKHGSLFRIPTVPVPVKNSIIEK